MLSMTLSTDERITNAHRAKLAYVCSAVIAGTDPAIRRRALSCNIASSSVQPCSVGQVSGFMSSTTILVSPGRPAEIGMASRR